MKETKLYSINSNTIDLKTETLSSTITWAHIIKFIEREKYLLLLPSNKSFHYLPKSGFESDEDILRLKNIVKEKGIKMTNK